MIRPNFEPVWRVLEVKPPELHGHVLTKATSFRSRHGPVLVGLDHKGRRVLLIPVPTDVQIIGTDTGRVHLSRRLLMVDGREPEPFLELSCGDPLLFAVFTTLTEDLVASLRPDEDPIHHTRKVLHDWQALLTAQPRRHLGSEALLGLVSELLVLREIITAAPGCDIDVWKGPDKGPHDFCRGPHALEVKGTLQHDSLSVEIHGVDQLETPADGSLHLVVVRLRKDGPLSLPGLVDELLRMVVNRFRFLVLLNAAGYDLPDADRYAEKRFTFVERRAYRVDDSFPRIIPASFIDGRPPAGVTGLRYRVDLTGPAPRPLEEPAAVEAIRSLGGGT